jgi:hypothetical protein
MSDLHDDYTIAGARRGWPFLSTDSEADTLRGTETDTLCTRGNPLLSDVRLQVRYQPSRMFAACYPLICYRFTDPAPSKRQIGT